MTEQDDLENWSYATSASKGVIARRYPYNYQMGLGQEYGAYDSPGVLTDRIAEQNQRGFYQRWAALMDAKNWAAPVTKGRTRRSRTAVARRNGH
jgi:hypothetical protein